jgi:hypothetical protein
MISTKKKIVKENESKESVERKRVIQEEVNQRMVDDFQIQFCPYGYSDIETALNVIEESEISDTYPPDFLYEEIKRYKDETGTEDLTDIDPVALMYDLILQTARGEITEKTGFDLENDSIASTSIYVAGNYLATSYDRSEDAVTEIQEKLDENTLTREDFSKPTQWFFDGIGL